MLAHILVLLISLTISPFANGIQINSTTLVNLGFSNDSVVIDLSNFNIEGIFPGTFDGYENLTYLYLDSNKLKKVEAKTFAKLENLKEIWLESNEITSFDKNALIDSKNIQVICMNNNPVSVIFPQLLQGLCGTNPSCTVKIKENCKRKVSGKLFRLEF